MTQLRTTRKVEEEPSAKRPLILRLHVPITEMRTKKIRKNYQWKKTRMKELLMSRRSRTKMKRARASKCDIARMQKTIIASWRVVRLPESSLPPVLVTSHLGLLKIRKLQLPNLQLRPWRVVQTARRPCKITPSCRVPFTRFSTNRFFNSS